MSELPEIYQNAVDMHIVFNCGHEVDDHLNPAVMVKGVKVRCGRHNAVVTVEDVTFPTE